MAGEIAPVDSEESFVPRNFVEAQMLIARKIEIDAAQAVTQGLRDSDETRKEIRFGEVKQMLRKLSDAVRDRTISQDEFETAIAALIVDLEISSVFDDKTGLPARVVFERLAPRIFEGAVQLKQPVVVFVADVDCLKETNDDREHGGHDMGDKLINVVARALKHRRGDSDVLCRMAVGVQGGSDEFVWLATDTRGEEAEWIVEGVVRQVSEELEELGLTGLRYRPGVSIGYAEWRDGITLKELLKEADQRMYDKKRHKKGIIPKA